MHCSEMVSVTHCNCCGFNVVADWGICALSVSTWTPTEPPPPWPSETSLL